MKSISEADRAIILSSLKNGLGLTKSAALTNMHPRDVSKYILNHPDFKSECLDYIDNGKKSMIIKLNKLFAEDNFQAWKKQVDALDKFIYNLNLWESICKAEQVNASYLIDAITMSQFNYSEAATCLGIVETQLHKYLANNSYAQTIVNNLSQTRK